MSKSIVKVSALNAILCCYHCHIMPVSNALVRWRGAWVEIARLGYSGGGS